MHASPSAMPSAEPNVTPMIDVLLVLLIVFMMAVMQVHRTMDVQLSQPCAGNCGGTDQIVLEVRPGPTYRINQRVVASEQLARRLADIYGSRHEKIMQLAGYPGVRYDDVVAAMDVAKSAGVRVIGIAPRSSYLNSR